MLSIKRWRILNLSLAGLVLLLLLPLLGVSFPSVGQAELFLHPDLPSCMAEFEDEFSPVDMARCCLGAAQQLSCERQSALIDGQRLDWHCSTGSGTISYRLNHPGYLSCTIQPFWKH